MIGFRQTFKFYAENGENYHVVRLLSVRFVWASFWLYLFVVHYKTRFNIFVPRLHEFDEQVRAVRDGMSRVVPAPLLALFNAAELETLVCGSPDIPVNALRASATYKGNFYDVQSVMNQRPSLKLY